MIKKQVSPISKIKIIFSKTPDQKPKSPSNESPELELKNYPIEKIEEVTEPGTTDSEGTQVSATLHQVQQN